MRASLRLLLLGTALASAPVLSSHAAQFVANGGFETLTNGHGQLAFNTEATGWSVPAPGGSYAFAFDATDVGSGVNGQYGGLALWTTGNGGTSTITASPDGGNFLAIDSAFQVGALTQAITGLVVGQTYALDFHWAGAQQQGFDGATFDNVTVSLGAESHATSTITVANHDFSGWRSEHFTFTAASTSEILTFLVGGGPPGVPPFALLDGISLTGPAAMPEPATIALFGCGLLGLCGLVRRRR